jgi:glyoxylase-like metal-dependent hydrolase (beta-lactamase superfamily II)
MSVHFEAPFLFLLLGAERALLVDTGATADPRYFPLRRVVDEAVERWLELHPCPSYELVVAHTHGHGDHIAADGQFADRPRTVTVGPELGAVTAFYGLPDWPKGRAALDLGGRVVDVIPGPGHEPAATVFHDRRTGLLLTGDTLYPGHLYVRDLAAYTATVERLLAFCEHHPVTHLLGCHVEMTTAPGDAYPSGTTHQPDEPPLEMTVGHLRALRRALGEIDGRAGTHRFDDFVLHISG